MGGGELGGSELMEGGGLVRGCGLVGVVVWWG